MAHVEDSGNSLAAWHDYFMFKKPFFRPGLMRIFMISDATDPVFFPHLLKKRGAVPFAIKDKGKPAKFRIFFKVFQTAIVYSLTKGVMLNIKFFSDF